VISLRVILRMGKTLVQGKRARGREERMDRKAHGQDGTGRGGPLPAMMSLVILERGRATA
jgi:hypothetical protein